MDLSNPADYLDVIELLRRLPDNVLFHSKYPYRHPVAIYQLSIRQLARDFSRVLKDYALLRSGAQSLAEMEEQMAQSQRILVYSLREHIDDCFMILMCLVDPTKIPAQCKYPDEKLKACGFAELKTLRSGIDNYLDSYLTPLVNSLKHS